MYFERSIAYLLGMLSFLIKDKEAVFWEWFVNNKSKIEDFLDSDLSDLTVYKQLSKKIKNYNSLLCPELTKTEDNKYVLIITPDGKEDGKEDGIEPTKRLFANRPKIDRWIIKKYRQPCDEIGLNFNGVEYPSSDIKIIPKFEDQDRVDLQMFIRNLNNDEKGYKGLAYLYLDHILGEFNSITKIRYVDFYHLGPDKSVKGGISLLELRKLIEKELY